MSAGGSRRLVVLGLSHRTAPVEQREKAALHPDRVRELLRGLAAAPGVAECAALSTCNRTEVYAVCDDAGAGTEAAVRALVAASRISEPELRCAHYAHHDEHAAGHLFRVAAGLDSMVLGESDVQGQVRAAADLAREEETLGPLLRGLFRQAVTAGRRVRRETSIACGATSLSSVAVGIALRHHPDLGRRRVLLVGAGRMAAATGHALRRHGARDVVVANRTPSAARELAAELGGSAVGLDALAGELARADLVVACTEAPHVIVQRDDVARGLAARPRRPLTLIDLAVPRDIDPEVGEVPGAALYDVDDLARAVEQGLMRRRRDVAHAERIVEEEVGRFRAWRHALVVNPTVESLHARAEQIRRAELARAARGLEPAQLQSLDAITRALVTKLLHEPTMRLRETGSLRHADAIRELFALDGDRGEVVELRPTAVGEEPAATGSPPLARRGAG